MKIAVETTKVFCPVMGKNKKQELLLDKLAHTIRQFPAEKQREIIKRYTVN